jgi:ubiquinone/menaquinone biosynthesis C-methylase UbiE
MDKNTADKIIKQNQENYDFFAESFSQTRNYLPEVTKSLFEGRVKAGDHVLDNGCGNGRFYPFFKERGANYVGIDNSERLVDIAKKKFPEANFNIGDVLELPFASGEFDLVVSMAVLHHIPSKAYRKKFFREAARVLKPNGILIVSVWDVRLQQMVRARQWRRLKSYIKTQAMIPFGFHGFDFGDFYIYWQKRFRRYIHAFKVSELEGLAKSEGFSIEQSGIQKWVARENNLYIIAKKAQD